MHFNPNQDFKSSYQTIERPMQHSMIQLNSRSPQPLPKSPLSYQELPQYQTMKKSYVSSDNPQLDDSPTSPKHNYAFPLKQNTYQQLNRDQKINNDSGTTSAALREKLSPSNRPQFKLENTSEELFKTPSKNSEGGGLDLKRDQLLKDIFSELKEHYLPSLVKVVKKEVMDEVFTLKAQMENLRQQTRKVLRKQQNSLLELQLITSSLKNQSKSRQSAQINTSPDLQTHFFLMEAKIAQLQSNFSNSLKEYQQKLSILESKLTTRSEVKFGTLKSSLPPLLLQYRETMTLKQGNKKSQFLLGQSIYYIDRQGYLLDHQNYYILDSSGSQIKLEDKHLKLLSIESTIKE